MRVAVVAYLQAQYVHHVQPYLHDLVRLELVRNVPPTTIPPFQSRVWLIMHVYDFFDLYQSIGVNLILKDFTS